MLFEMSPKAILILLNKNVPRTTFKPGSGLKMRDNPGNKKARPALLKPTAWSGVEGEQIDKPIVSYNTE